MDGSVDVFVRACIFSQHLVHARRYRTVPAGFSPVHSLGLPFTFRIAVSNFTEQCRMASSDTNCSQPLEASSLSLYVCMYVCVYICMYIYICIYTHIYIHTHIHTYIHISFHLMKKTIRPAEFAAVTTVDVTLLLGCDAVKFGIVKACAVAIFRGGWVCG